VSRTGPGRAHRPAVSRPWRSSLAAARALRAVAAAAVVGLLSSPAVQACQACFGAEDAPIVDGAKAGAWILIGLTFCIEGAFAGFFLYLRRRARRASGTAPRTAIHALRRQTRWS
jgi:hypothetical protein